MIADETIVRTLLEPDQEELADMAVDSNWSLTDSELCYAAFRAAFFATLDGMLREYLDPQSSDAPVGFLDRIPLLKATAPHVQLECLLATWRKCEDGTQLLNTLDYCVFHAAMDTLAALSLSDEQETLQAVWRGPQAITTPISQWLYSQVRCLQCGMSWEGWKAEPGMLSPAVQFQYVTMMPGDSFDHDNELPVVRELLEIVGRWKVNQEILRNSDGLLTVDEQGLIRTFFAEHRGLLG